MVLLYNKAEPKIEEGTFIVVWMRLSSAWLSMEGIFWKVQWQAHVCVMDVKRWWCWLILIVACGTWRNVRNHDWSWVFVTHIGSLRDLKPALDIISLALQARTKASYVQTYPWMHWAWWGLLYHFDREPIYTFMFHSWWLIALQVDERCMQRWLHSSRVKSTSKDGHFIFKMLSEKRNASHYDNNFTAWNKAA